ncbi:MAG TPA: Rnf-Nqr domain containing protein, partial [Spirochaetota bacterium]|nr:Rnf-Nqr domain containing protein [Spirochaetota bacterium]
MSDDTKTIEKLDREQSFRDSLLYKEFIKGFFKENPSLVLLLGICPTLAVTTKVSNAIGMGLSATFVLICSNILISLLKDFIPDKVETYNTNAQLILFQTTAAVPGMNVYTVVDDSNLDDLGVNIS